MIKELTDTETDLIWEQAKEDAIHGQSNHGRYEEGSPEAEFYEFALRQHWLNG